MEKYEKFYQGEIPENFQKRVLSKTKLQADEKVVLFIDQGKMKKSTAGLIFTDRCIHRYGRFSYKMFPYSDVKKISLFNMNQAFCNISVTISTELVLGSSAAEEQHPLGSIATEAHPLLFRLISPYIAEIEADKPAPELRLDMIKKGIFYFKIDRFDEVIRNARCYLVFPEEKTRVILKDAGIDFSQLQMFKGGIGEGAGRGFHRGISPVDLMVTSAASEQVELYVPWDTIHGFGKELVLDLIEKEKNSEKYDREKRSVYMFFWNTPKEREEWLRLEMFTVQERDLFLENVKNYGVRVDLSR